MTRTVRNACATLLPLALAALGAGCARDASPPRSGSTPMFEASVGGSLDHVRATADDDRGAAALGGPGVPGARYADQELGDQVTGAGAGPSDASGPEAPVGAGASPNLPQRVDRSSIDAQPTAATSNGRVNQGRVCQAIQQADLVVDDIPGGARIVLKPRAAEGYEALRLDASRLVREASTPTTSGTVPGDECALFALTRKGAAATLSESARGLELRFTTEGDLDEDAVREQVRRFVKSAGGKENAEDR